jgi:hypothetical protein
MSLALLAAGIRLPVSHDLYTIPAAKDPYKGVRIALRQKELSNYLKALWGAPKVLKNVGGQVPAPLSTLRGVVSFFGIPGYLGGSGGHLDIWDGLLGQCRHDGYWNANEFWFWQAT